MFDSKRVYLSEFLYYNSPGWFGELFGTPTIHFDTERYIASENWAKQKAALKRIKEAHNGKRLDNT